MAELYFFYGTLCHLPLLEAVLGHVPLLRPARFAGHEVRMALNHAGEPLGFPVLVPGPLGATGVLAEIGAAAALRLDFYETGYACQPLEVQDAAGLPVQALAYLPQPGRWQAGTLWQLEEWAACLGPLDSLAARDFMALQGQMTAEAALAHYPQIRVRAGSRLRAALPRPASLRRQASPEDVQVESRQTPYAQFFAVEDYHLRHRLFQGGLSAPLSRAAFVSGDAAVVLPYDPRQDRVLLVEQFRTGPFARGDANPWQIEAVAGRVDAGETPEEAARREAQEEAGLTLTRLIAAPHFYPSPGAKSEFLYCYIGLCELPDAAPGFGGLPEEGEDIRSHRLPFAELMRLVESGEAENAPLLVLALWLERLRPQLRQAAGALAPTQAGS